MSHYSGSQPLDLVDAGTQECSEKLVTKVVEMQHGC